MIRDGRDVAASFKGRVRAENAAFAIRKGSQRWVEDTTAGLVYAEHPQLLTVRYESFALDPKAVMTTVFDFLGEEFDPAVIFDGEKSTSFNGIESTNIGEKPTNEAANHAELRAYQVSHGLFDGRGRWREDLPRGLAADERTVVHQIAGGLLAELGYALNDSWV
jgi:hypothetical protein